MTTEVKPRYAGADWIAANYKLNGEPLPLSPLGRKVAEIVGAVVRGIYHIEQYTADVDWSNERFIEIRTHNSFLANISTYDCSALTELVVLCHDAAIRLEISACIIPWPLEGTHEDDTRELREGVEDLGLDPDDICGTPGLKLTFTQRQREGCGMTRHPAMEQAIESARKLTPYPLEPEATCKPSETPPTA
jgi:hypothetical protein